MFGRIRIALCSENIYVCARLRFSHTDNFSRRDEDGCHWCSYLGLRLRISVRISTLFYTSEYPIIVVILCHQKHSRCIEWESTSQPPQMSWHGVRNTGDWFLRPINVFYFFALYCAETHLPFLLLLPSTPSFFKKKIYFSISFSIINLSWFFFFFLSWFFENLERMATNSCTAYIFSSWWC